jgi:hypothetical protein
VALSHDFSDSVFVDITMDQTLDLGFIDAAQYPFMYLTFHTADLFTLTAASVDYWRVCTKAII